MTNKPLTTQEAVEQLQDALRDVGRELMKTWPLRQLERFMRWAAREAPAMSELDKVFRQNVRLLARVAELEAELAAYRIDNKDEYTKRLAAEAELAALNGRRCWTCRWHANLSHGGNAYIRIGFDACPLFGTSFEADGFCHLWAEREP